MAEPLTDREINLILEGLSSARSAAESSTAAINSINVQLAKDYLTKQEDERHDAELKTHLETLISDKVKASYGYTDTQFKDLKSNLKGQIVLLRYAIVGLGSITLIMLGYLVNHTWAIPQIP